MTSLIRCSWANSSELMTAYHDNEWGVPAHDDTDLFEMLILEGAQAGLSWSTVLNKRAACREALEGFDWDRISRYDQAKLNELLTNPGIIRNRLKLASVVTNARAFAAVRAEFGSFDAYLWGWVDGSPLNNRPKPGDPVVSRSELSNGLSKDLRRRGFSFVGTTIIYAYLQAVGVVNDHATTCTVQGSPPGGRSSSRQPL